MTFETALRFFFSILPAQIPVIAVGAIGLYFVVSRRDVAPRAQSFWIANQAWCPTRLSRGVNMRIDTKMCLALHKVAR
jgi:hypothetical protein